jgi:hypothetical protein
VKIKVELTEKDVATAVQEYLSRLDKGKVSNVEVQAHAGYDDGPMSSAPYVTASAYIDLDFGGAK